MRGVTCHMLSYSLRRKEFQLTRLMRGVTDSETGLFSQPKISTHTPHARRDRSLKDIERDIRISTHTPHARRDLYL